MRAAFFPVSVLALLGLCIPRGAIAATLLVDSIPALQSAINAANAGDTLTLRNGVYSTSQAITVSRAGAAGQPIIIAAESTGGVEITGTHGFSVSGTAAYVVIAGFKFTHASGSNRINEGASQVRITRNIFLCSGDGAYLTVSADDTQIDHNEFGEKKSAGSMLAVSGTGSQVARRLWIHHNYFHDLASSGGDGAQMIRLGLMSAHSQSIGGCLVEHNLFSGCRGVSEVISNRASGNIYRYNTLLDSPTSQLTLRQGDDCSVYGNYFRNTEGVRIYGDRHRIFSNYFEGNAIAVAIGNGAPATDDGTPNKNDRPDDCVIAFNTFIDNRAPFSMSRRTPEALGATNTTFANNLIQGGGTAVKIAGPYTGASWIGNLIWITTKIGDIPAEGFILADPLLAAGPDGVQRPQPGSPVIGTASASFPEAEFDLDGQPRTKQRSIGADEPSTAPTTARLLSSTDVGPNAPDTNMNPVADAVSGRPAPTTAHTEIQPPAKNGGESAN